MVKFICTSYDRDMQIILNVGKHPTLGLLLMFWHLSIISQHMTSTMPQQNTLLWSLSSISHLILWTSIYSYHIYLFNSVILHMSLITLCQLHDLPFFFLNSRIRVLVRDKIDRWIMGFSDFIDYVHDRHSFMRSLQRTKMGSRLPENSGHLTSHTLLETNPLEAMRFIKSRDISTFLLGVVIDNIRKILRNN